MIEPVYIYRATAVRVVDGDTFLALVDQGFGSFQRINVRVRGLNTPEQNESGGDAATGYVRNLIEGRPVVIQSFKDRRSFERWVCDVWVDGASLAAMIVAAGYGVAV